MAIYKGAGVALVTPMKDNTDVDYDALRDLIDFQIDNGVDAILLAGTTGEGSTLSIKEHCDVIKRGVEFVKGRVPVIAGTGSNNTRTAIELTKEAEKDGADAALIVSPYYNKATQKGLITHFSHIADETKLPIILYNIPGRTGVNIQPETVASLIKTKENIVGIKEATGDFTQASKIMYLTDGKIEMYSGEDGLIVPLLSIGGIGVLSVICNIAPQDTHDMIMAYLNGDTDKAMMMQRKMIPLVDELFAEVNPIPVKHALNAMGIKAGPLREPLTELSDEKKITLEKAMKDYGLL